MTSLAVGFPLDTGMASIGFPDHVPDKSGSVKVRFQDPLTAGRYSSTFSALTTIIKEEKFRGLYKGITSPMVNV